MAEQHLSTSNTGSNYVIPAEDDEKQRLGAQYLLKKGLTGWTGAVPPSVDTSRFTRVLDVGAGTCSWTLDFARMPEVRARLEVPGHGNATERGIKLFACDIEPKFFPSDEVLAPYGITMFQQDVTKPFPEGMHGTFDLVHMCLLFLCLTEDGWNAALRNCRQILKPGGLLMLEEADPVLYNGVQPPPEDAPGHDFEAQMSVPGWVGRANCIYTRFTLVNGFFADLTFRLPGLLRAAGYDVVDTKRTPAPWGKYCSVVQPYTTGNLSEYAEFSIENMRFIFVHLAMALLSKGLLTEPDGTKVETADAMEKMLQDVETGLREEGAFSLTRYCIAKKTSD